MSGYLEYKLYLLKRNKMAKSNLHNRENSILKPCHFAGFSSIHPTNLWKYFQYFTLWSNNGAVWLEKTETPAFHLNRVFMRMFAVNLPTRKPSLSLDLFDGFECWLRFCHGDVPCVGVARPGPGPRPVSDADFSPELRESQIRRSREWRSRSRALCLGRRSVARNTREKGRGLGHSHITETRGFESDKCIYWG